MVAKLRTIVAHKPVKPPPDPPEATGDAELDGDAWIVHERVLSARQEHRDGLEVVTAWIGSHEAFELVDVVLPRQAGDAEADLVITVGGDGTFLTASRYLAETPMLGFNSAPSTSVGHYCGATADCLGEVLDRIAAGELTPSPLHRIAVHVDGVATEWPALNDVLFANQSPVASTRYVLRIGDRRELQLSSGIWFATASGSTAAIRSAGGEVMAPDDRRIQYLVREPYAGGDNGMGMLHGYAGASIQVMSRGDRNVVFVDGARVGVPAPAGSWVTISLSPTPLKVFAYPGETDGPRAC